MKKYFCFRLLNGRKVTKSVFSNIDFVNLWVNVQKNKGYKWLVEVYDLVETFSEEVSQIEIENY